MTTPEGPFESLEHPSPDHAAARRLVLRHGWNTVSYQILNPGIRHWFTEDRRCVIGYVRTRTHLVAAGSPVAADEDLPRCIDGFLRFAAAQERRVCFFGAQERTTSILRTTAPVSLFALGAQPVWHPEAWLRTVIGKPSLRAQIRRAENKASRVTVLEFPMPDSVRELRPCLNEWLASRPLLPMHFLVEPDTLSVPEDRIFAVAAIGKRITGFCVATPIPLRNGWLIEQIIRRPEAPNGTAELLLERTITHLASRNAEMITLGLAPLSLRTDATTPMPFEIASALALTRRFGEPFYHFRGLEAFKAKFEPEEWEPVYAVSNERRASFGMLHAVVSAFTGGTPIRFLAGSITRSFTRSLHR